MTVTRLIARPMLASMFFVGAVSALKNADAIGVMAQPVTDKVIPMARKAVPAAPIPTDATTLVRLNAVAQLAAAGALATGRAPRLSSTVLAVSFLPATVFAHRFWQESDPAERSSQRADFFKNISMLGGLLLAGVDTEGKPGVAWRVRRAGSDVKREARQLAKDARRETKLAKAQLT